MASPAPPRGTPKLATTDDDEGTATTAPPPAKKPRRLPLLASPTAAAWDERVYRGTENDDDADESSSNPAATEASEPPRSRDTSSIPLPMAVRACWPEAFPTKSSAKKCVRQGRVWVLSAKEPNDNAHDEPGTDDAHHWTRGTCGTRIAPGARLRRKIVDAAAHHARRQDRGPSTQALLERWGHPSLALAHLDDHLAMVVKPHGTPVFKTRAAEAAEKDEHAAVSLHEILGAVLPPSPHDDALRRPAACHRLDQPTFGLVVVARTHTAARVLGRAFGQKTAGASQGGAPAALVKRYRALLHGHLGVSGSHNRHHKSIDGSDHSHVKSSSSSSRDDHNNSTHDGTQSGIWITTPLGGKACRTECFVREHLWFHPPPTKETDGSIPAAQHSTTDRGSHSSSGGSNSNSTSTSKNSTSSGSSHSTTTSSNHSVTVPLTLVDFCLHTGRKHQLRRHAAETLGHPIVGDDRYTTATREPRCGIDPCSANAALQRWYHGWQPPTDRPPPPLPLLLAAVDLTLPHPSSGPHPRDDHSQPPLPPPPWTHRARGAASVWEEAAANEPSSRRRLRVTIPPSRPMEALVRACTTATLGGC